MPSSVPILLSYEKRVLSFLSSLLHQLKSLKTVQEIQKKRKIIFYSFCTSLILVVSIYLKYKKTTPKRLRFTHFAQGGGDQEGVYDVAIVGAGPSGAACAYYLAKEGYKVLLVEKKTFPRDKFCGDVVTTTAQHYLSEMGVMKEIIDEGKGYFIKNGGFVSPCGNSFVGEIYTPKEENGSGSPSKNGNNICESGGTVATIKRIILDEKIANAAKKMGAKLVEGTTVVGAVFSRVTGMWTLDARMDSPSSIFYMARALVCADGAQSKLARHLGVVKTGPNGVCSRSYVVPPYPFKWDGVFFYPRSLLPGCCAIVREVDGELNYITYILSGGLVKEEDLARLHHEYIKKDPYISQALGGSPAMERMKAGSVRVGGVEKSYDDHVVVIGDAAGFVDPSTGLGLQYALEGGKVAAKALKAGFLAGDLSSDFLRRNYHARWVNTFGVDFYWSMKMTFLLYRFPIVFDATAKLIQRRGARFFEQWVRAVTGARPKTWFLQLNVFPFLCFEVVIELIRRQFSRRK